MSNPFIPDYAAIDREQHRRTWHMAFIVLCMSALCITSLVAALFYADGTRILNAACAQEEVV